MKGRTEPTIAPEDIRAALCQIKDPDLGRDIVTLGFIKDLRIDGESVSFAIELTTPRGVQKLSPIEIRHVSSGNVDGGYSSTTAVGTSGRGDASFLPE